MRIRALGVLLCSASVMASGTALATPVNGPAGSPAPASTASDVQAVPASQTPNTAVDPTSASTPPQDQAAAPQAAGAADNAGDIIVTAQRRSETLQKVPLSITAIEPAQLRTLNISSVNQIQLITPALVYEQGYSYSQTYIRGIGTNLPNPGLEGAVATYVDGAYLQRNLGTVGDLFDTGTIQVLKGPQGTLYGRNATGGAILITTADPTDKRSLHLGFEYGSYNRVVGEAVANVPLTDTLAIRVAARESHEDGYVNNLYDGSKFGGRVSYTIRGKIRYAPTDDFSAVLGVEYSHREERGGFTAERAPAPICLACSIPGAGAAPVRGFYDTDNDTNIPFENRSFSANLKLRYDTGALALESVTSYRDERQHAIIDQDYSRIPLFNFDENNGGKTFTQDVQASTSYDGIINGLVGVSYLNDRASIIANITGGAFAALLPITGGTFPSGQNRVNTDSIAGFGEVYITPIQHLKITLGGRYTHDTRELDSTINFAASLALAPPGSPLTFAQHATFNSFTPRAVIAYDFGVANVYASYNRGFKAGGFATPTFSATNIVNPEKIDSYEAGIKIVSNDHKLRLNLSGFYYKYRDIQVSIVDLSSGGLRTQNAASARGYGLEADANYALSSAFTIFGGATYLNARYESYTNASVNVLTATGGLTSGVENLSGTPLQRAPDFTGFGGANLNVPISGDWIGNLNGVVRYTTSYDFYPGRGGPLGFDYQPAYTFANVTGSVGPADKSYSIGFYVDNLTNARYFIQRGTGQPFGQFEQVARPRTYGLRLSANF